MTDQRIDAMEATIDQLLHDIIWPHDRKSFLTIGLLSDGRVIVADNAGLGAIGRGENLRDALLAFQVAFFQAVEDPPGECGFHGDMNWTNAVREIIL